MRAEEAVEEEGEVEADVAQLCGELRSGRVEEGVGEGQREGARWTHHSPVRLGDLERLVDDAPVLVDAVHLPPEHLGVDLDLLARPPDKACATRSPSQRVRKERERAR